MKGDRMKYIIDRFEEGLAVCEDMEGNMINIYDYPVGAKEGDCLCEMDGKLYINQEETEKLKKEAQQLLEDIFN